MTSAKIEIFTSPTCPHCPSAKRAVSDFAKNRDDVKVVETSTATKKGSDRAMRFDVRGVPTIIVTGPGTDERIGYVGAPSKSGLEKMVRIAKGEDNWDVKGPGILARIAKKFKINLKI